MASREVYDIKKKMHDRAALEDLNRKLKIPLSSHSEREAEDQQFQLQHQSA